MTGRLFPCYIIAIIIFKGLFVFMNNFKRYLSFLFVTVSASAVMSCKTNLDRYNDFKNDHAGETRRAFIREELAAQKEGLIDEVRSDAEKHKVGREQKRRTEWIYTRRLGWHNAKRANTDKENTDDKLEFAARVEEKQKLKARADGVAQQFNHVADIVSDLAYTKAFNQSADNRCLDSLDTKTFGHNVQELAIYCADYNVTLVNDTLAPPLPPLYQDAYQELLGRVKMARNQKIGVNLNSDIPTSTLSSHAEDLYKKFVSRVRTIAR